MWNVCYYANEMKIKILKEIKGTWHTLQKNEVYDLPYLTQCKKTKRRLLMEVVESERWEAGFFVCFHSESNSEKDSYAGCGFPLKLHEDFEILENTSACTTISSASKSTQINLFEND